MSKQYMLSPYQYDPERQLCIAQHKKPQNIKLQGNEVAIIRTLAKYRVLVKSGIYEMVNETLPENRRKPNFDKELNNLFKGGFIRKYHYEGAQNGRENLVVFTLADKGTKYAKEKQIRFSYTPISDEERYTTSTILELVTLNMWHIQNIKKNKENIRTESYQFSVRLPEGKNAVIPSLITFNNSEWSLLEEFTIAAIPFYKENNKEIKGAFFNSLMSLQSFFSTNKSVHKNHFIVVLVDCFEQMKLASEIIYEFKVLQRLQVYFSIDEYANDEQPLRWLYEVERGKDTNSNTTRYNLIDLTQKGEANDEGRT